MSISVSSDASHSTILASHTRTPRGHGCRVWWCQVQLRSSSDRPSMTWLCLKTSSEASLLHRIGLRMAPWSRSYRHGSKAVVAAQRMQKQMMRRKEPGREAVAVAKSEDCHQARSSLIGVVLRRLVQALIRARVRPPLPSVLEPPGSLAVACGPRGGTGASGLNGALQTWPQTRGSQFCKLLQCSETHSPRYGGFLSWIDETNVVSGCHSQPCSFDPIWTGAAEERLAQEDSSKAARSSKAEAATKADDKIYNPSFVWKYFLLKKKMST